MFDCHAITSVSFTSSTPTPTTSATQTLVTDYTSTDIGNGNVYKFATAYVTVDTSNYGGLADFTGVVETSGVGTATFERVPEYQTTDGLTTYFYAEATGNGDGDLTPVGTATATGAPAPTENCLKFVYQTDPHIGSRSNVYYYVLWGIAGWNTDDVEGATTSLLQGCNVDVVNVEADTGRWGTVAMWNNGDTEKTENFDCVKEGIDKLSVTPTCKTMKKDLMDVGAAPEDSAAGQLDWIYSHYPKAISSPYPLQT